MFLNHCSEYFEVLPKPRETHDSQVSTSPVIKYKETYWNMCFKTLL